jgi:hypothetical protein
MLVMVSNNTMHPIFKLIGQEKYTSRRRARREMDRYIHKLKTDGLVSPEIGSILGYIYKEDGTIQKGDDYEYYVDYRFGGSEDIWND